MTIVFVELLFNATWSSQKEERVIIGILKFRLFHGKYNISAKYFLESHFLRKITIFSGVLMKLDMN